LSIFVANLSNLIDFSEVLFQTHFGSGAARSRRSRNDFFRIQMLLKVLNPTGSINWCCGSVNITFKSGSAYLQSWLTDPDPRGLLLITDPAGSYYKIFEAIEKFVK
jgi:hypothetical protein